MERQGHATEDACADVAVDGSASSTVLLIAALARNPTLSTLVDATQRVLGRPVDLRLFDGAIRAGLLTFDGERLEFADAAVRSAVISRCTPWEQEQLHRALAAAQGDDAVARTWHSALAQHLPDDTLAAAAVNASRTLCGLGLFADGSTLLRHAVRLSGAGPTRAKRLVEAAGVALVMGRQLEGPRLLHEAHRSGPDEATRVVAHALSSAFSADIRMDGQDLTICMDASRALVEGQQHTVAFAVASLALLEAGRPVQPEELAPPASLSLGSPMGVTGMRGLCAYAVGDLAAAAQLIGEYAEHLPSTARVAAAAPAYLLLAHSALAVGDLCLARRSAAKARDLVDGRFRPQWSARAAAVEIVSRLLQGQESTQAELVQLHRFLLHSDPLVRRLGDLVHAVALMESDQWTDAWGLLADLSRADAASHPDVRMIGLAGYLAESAIRCGRQMQSRSLVTQLPEPNPGIGRADRAYASALLSDSEPDSALKQSLTTAAGQWPFLEARTELALGTSLRRDRRIAEARRHLLSAGRLFAALEMPTWVHRTDQELRASGTPTPGSQAPVELNGPGRLSVQEQAIARLVAEGLTNRQVGERLFLSPRTIGSHLYRIFPKLGVSSRTQLAARLNSQ